MCHGLGNKGVSSLCAASFATFRHLGHR
jgi:hypothetical protein